MKKPDFNINEFLKEFRGLSAVLNKTKEPGFDFKEYLENPNYPFMVYA